MKPKLKMEDLLGALGSESEQEKHKLEIERSPAVDDLCERFRAFLLQYDYMKMRNQYDDAAGYIPTKCNARDVQQFSILMAEHQEDVAFPLCAGAYLSALVSHCTDKEVTIVTQHLNSYVELLGWHNQGHTLVIRGDVDSVATDMKGGKVIVEGLATRVAGYRMKGGELILQQFRGECIGEALNGGKIVCHANVSSKVGTNMRDGEIWIDGSCGGLGKDITGGNIYVQGRQIVKDGKIL